jgi:WD40 repeat protein
MLAAGLGDGNIPIYSVENRKLVQMDFLAEGHDSSVASITWADFDNHHHTATTTTSPQRRILCSGGSDGAILCWDVGSKEQQLLLFDDEDDDDTEQAQQKQSSWDLFPEALLEKNTKELSLLLRDNASVNKSSKIMFGIPHGKKLNWIATTGREQSAATLFAADISNDITSYTIPLR